MQTFDQFKAQPEGELVAMFQVEELEERLENKWELEAGINKDGPYCSVKCTPDSN